MSNNSNGSMGMIGFILSYVTKMLPLCRPNGRKWIQMDTRKQVILALKVAFFMIDRHKKYYF